MLNSLFLFSLGLFALIFGSSLLVSSLKTISLYFKLKPLFLSILILGFVSSFPEWCVTITASFKNLSDVAVGNVVGSNIINILLVLALAGLFYKCPADRQIIRFDIPVLIASFVIVALFSRDQKFDRFEALLLLGIFSLYLLFLFYKRKIETPDPLDSAEKTLSRLKALALLISGFLILFIGSSLAVDSSLKLVEYFGLSERFAGVFILSLSTSLPELAITLQASIKKEGAIAMGNIIGSNIFNTLFILGSAGLVNPLLFSKGIYNDGLFMFFIILILWLCLLWLKRLTKMICGAFIFLYFLYIAFVSELIDLSTLKVWL